MLNSYDLNFLIMLKFIIYKNITGNKIFSKRENSFTKPKITF